MTIGIIAASSVVPQVEFNNGVSHLRNAGFEVRIHPQIVKENFIFAGADDERADALYSYATDPEIDLLWCARGGYGAARILPLLEKLSAERGKPPNKLLVGYSDVTVLHEFVRNRWGWSTLHAPMPAASNFRDLRADEWQEILDYVHKKPAAPPWEYAALRWLTDPPTALIKAELIGGNLSLWVSLAGTPYAPPGRGKIIFLEDLSEPYYRLDRMMTQLVQAGLLDGAAAIVLGDFCDCKDEGNDCLVRPGSTDKKPLRKVYDEAEGFMHIFGTVGKKLGIPVATGLPVGHGPNFAPLPLGGQYELSPPGRLKLVMWDWSKTR